jgi:hypothetical protein
MKPASRRGVWKAETAEKRLRRCLAFLRLGDFISAQEHGRILKRAARWKAKHKLRPLIKRHEKPQPPSTDSLSPALRKTIEERFRAFHAANPAIYKCILQLIKERFLRGSLRQGMKAMWEQLRWRIATGNVQLASGFNFNNDFTSRYARLVVAEFPAYRGLFELRKLSAP